MLESFGLAFDAMNSIPGALACPYPSTCFVPTGSAVAVRGADPWQDLSADVSNLSPDNTAFDDYRCASQNERHTTMTEELGMWILDRIAR